MNKFEKWYQAEGIDLQHKDFAETCFNAGYAAANEPKEADPDCDKCNGRGVLCSMMGSFTCDCVE